MIDLRLRTRISDEELDAKVGKIVTPGDYNLVLTGPARVRRPDGAVMAVYLPGVLAGHMAEHYDVLQSIRIMTDNRGKASGTPRVKRGDQKRTRTRRIHSATVGAVDPGPSTTRASGRLPVCRLTSWTGKNMPEWQALQPLFQAIAGHMAEQVPDRYQVQQAWADRTHADWVIPDTPFTTVTVNNTYSTGVHQDAGDLEAGFSTLAVCRRGDYTGGQLVLPRYRIAVDMQDGDLLLFDAHEWHGNVAMRCPHDDGEQLARRCPEGCERISLVSYFRTKVQQCGTAEAEAAKAQAVAEAAGSRVL
jgi:hypothetical protein